MKELLLDLQYIFRPRFWMQNHSTCKVWDKRLNKLMDEAKVVEKTSSYSVTIDGVSIWTGNFPYAYGRMYEGSSLLPRCRTRERLQRFPSHDLLSASKLQTQHQNRHNNFCGRPHLFLYSFFHPKSFMDQFYFVRLNLLFIQLIVYKPL